MVPLSRAVAGVLEMLREVIGMTKHRVGAGQPYVPVTEARPPHCAARVIQTGTRRRHGEELDEFMSFSTYTSRTSGEVSSTEAPKVKRLKSPMGGLTLRRPIPSSLLRLVRPGLPQRRLLVAPELVEPIPLRRRFSPHAPAPWLSLHIRAWTFPRRLGINYLEQDRGVIFLARVLFLLVQKAVGVGRERA